MNALTHPSEIHEALVAAFLPGDMEWKVQTCGKSKSGKIWALVVPYITNRAIMERLDHTVGADRWRNRYEIIQKNGEVIGILCGISVRINDEWIEKMDGAEPTDIESFKGGLSNAMKRAAVHWGIGRFLYGIDDTWAEIVDKGQYRGKTKDGDFFEWNPPRLAFAAPKPTPREVSQQVEQQVEQLAQVAEATPKAAPVQVVDGRTKANAAFKLLAGDDEGILPAARFIISAYWQYLNASWEQKIGAFTALHTNLIAVLDRLGDVNGAKVLIRMARDIGGDQPNPEHGAQWAAQVAEMIDTGAVA